MFKDTSWIGLVEDFGSVCPVFFKQFALHGEVTSAILEVTAIGVYEAHLNGQRVGDFILAPGCTSYRTRLQVQSYDVKNLLTAENELAITVGTGWHRGNISSRDKALHEAPCGVIAELQMTYADGTSCTLRTDDSWQVRKSPILFADLYDGEHYDAQTDTSTVYPVKVLERPKTMLIPQEGEIVREQERIKPVAVITTPNGETVLDFGQNLTGYLSFCVDAHAGEEIAISHAEVLDAAGNFYRDNYRSAKAELHYICREGKQCYKPHFTFFGFRYIRLDKWPGEVNLGDFTAIVVYSDIRRTGRIHTGSALVNRLYENVLWSQRGNFLDVPTDCPQRDERMGWTGDAQAFAKTACYNYDVLRFMRKWLGDLRAEQRENGSIPDTVPNFWCLSGNSTAWADVITILPWQLYMTYGDKTVLAENFPAMKRWVDFMGRDTQNEYLWTTKAEQKGLWQKHYGDWLALDAPAGSYRGTTDDDLIASAFYAYSTELVVRTGHVLGEDVSAYETLYANIVRTFKARFSEPKTQTEHILLLHFHLTDEPERIAAQLNRMILDNGCKMQTGFVGTPYLLHVLTAYGYTETAYSLLLQEEYPSWLYEVTHGATTVWEHWDGINDQGTFWSADMNSYNHYAYGAVMDWVYEQAAGIQPDAPGFDRILVAPKPDPRLGWLDVSLETKDGTIRSSWRYVDGKPRYTISVPTDARIVVDGQMMDVPKGDYLL